MEIDRLYQQALEHNEKVKQLRLENLFFHKYVVDAIFILKSNRVINFG